MSKPWSEMESRERDAAIAVLMGWVSVAREARDNAEAAVCFRGSTVAEEIDPDTPRYYVDDKGDLFVGKPVFRADAGCKIFHWTRWSPTTDLNHAAQVEAEVYQRGLMGMFVSAISDVVQVSEDFDEGLFYDVTGDDVWKVLHATADQRCEAAYIVLSGERE